MRQWPPAMIEVPRTVPRAAPQHRQKAGASALIFLTLTCCSTWSGPRRECARLLFSARALPQQRAILMVHPACSCHAQHRPRRARGRGSAVHGVIVALCCTAVSLDAQGAQKAAGLLRCAQNCRAFVSAHEWRQPLTRTRKRVRGGLCRKSACALTCSTPTQRRSASASPARRCLLSCCGAVRYVSCVANVQAGGCKGAAPGAAAQTLPSLAARTVAGEDPWAQDAQQRRRQGRQGRRRRRRRRRRTGGRWRLGGCVWGIRTRGGAQE